MSWIKNVTARIRPATQGLPAVPEPQAWASPAQIRTMRAKAAAADPHEVAADHPELFTAWTAGTLRPWRCAAALNKARATGEWVSEACGAHGLEAGYWTAGRLYPTWENIVRLAALTGVPLASLMADDDRGVNFVGCGQAAFLRDIETRYLPQLVTGTVANHPAPMSTSEADSIVRDAYHEFISPILRALDRDVPKS